KVCCLPGLRLARATRVFLRPAPNGCKENYTHISAAVKYLSYLGADHEPSCIRDFHINQQRRHRRSDRCLGQLLLYNHGVFSFTSRATHSTFNPAIGRPTSINSPTRNSERPAAAVTNRSTPPASVQLVGSVCTRPSPSRNQTRSSPQFWRRAISSNCCSNNG